MTAISEAAHLNRDEGDSPAASHAPVQLEKFRHSGEGRNPAILINMHLCQCVALFVLLTGHRPDGTTSHSTKLANNASQVAGYSPV
jgi:hypothetical protein